jgi:hypothetical protein
MTVLFIFGELFSHSTLLTGVCRHHGGRDSQSYACVRAQIWCLLAHSLYSLLSLVAAHIQFPIRFYVSPLLGHGDRNTIP